MPDSKKLPDIKLSDFTSKSEYVDSSEGTIYKIKYNNDIYAFKQLKALVKENTGEYIKETINKIEKNSWAYIQMSKSEYLAPPLHIVVNEKKEKIGYTMKFLENYTRLDQLCENNHFDIDPIIKSIIRGFKDIFQTKLKPCPEHGANIMISPDNQKAVIIDLDDIEKCNSHTLSDTLKQLETIFIACADQKNYNKYFEGDKLKNKYNSLDSFLPDERERESKREQERERERKREQERERERKREQERERERNREQERERERNREDDSEDPPDENISDEEDDSEDPPDENISDEENFLLSKFPINKCRMKHFIDEINKGNPNDIFIYSGITNDRAPSRTILEKLRILAGTHNNMFEIPLGSKEGSWQSLSEQKGRDSVRTVLTNVIQNLNNIKIPAQLINDDVQNIAKIAGQFTKGNADVIPFLREHLQHLETFPNIDDVISKFLKNNIKNTIIYPGYHSKIDLIRGIDQVEDEADDIPEFTSNLPEHGVKSRKLIHAKFKMSAKESARMLKQNEDAIARKDVMQQKREAKKEAKIIEKKQRLQARKQEEKRHMKAIQEQARRIKKDMLNPKQKDGGVPGPVGFSPDSDDDSDFGESNTVFLNNVEYQKNDPNVFKTVDGYVLKQNGKIKSLPERELEWEDYITHIEQRSYYLKHPQQNPDEQYSYFIMFMRQLKKKFPNQIYEIPLDSGAVLVRNIMNTILEDAEINVEDPTVHVKMRNKRLAEANKRIKTENMKIKQENTEANEAQSLLRYLITKKTIKGGIRKLEITLKELLMENINIRQENMNIRERNTKEIEIKKVKKNIVWINPRKYEKPLYKDWIPSSIKNYETMLEIFSMQDWRDIEVISDDETKYLYTGFHNIEKIVDYVKQIEPRDKYEGENIYKQWALYHEKKRIIQLNRIYAMRYLRYKKPTQFTELPLLDAKGNMWTRLVNPIGRMRTTVEEIIDKEFQTIIQSEVWQNMRRNLWNPIAENYWNRLDEEDMETASRKIIESEVWKDAKKKTPWNPIEQNYQDRIEELEMDDIIENNIFIDLLNEPVNFKVFYSYNTTNDSWDYAVGKAGDEITKYLKLKIKNLVEGTAEKFEYTPTIHLTEKIYPKININIGIKHRGQFKSFEQSNQGKLPYKGETHIKGNIVVQNLDCIAFMRTEPKMKGIRQNNLIDQLPNIIIDNLKTFFDQLLQNKQISIVYYPYKEKRQQRKGEKKKEKQSKIITLAITKNRNTDGDSNTDDIPISELYDLTCLKNWEVVKNIPKQAPKKIYNIPRDVYAYIQVKITEGDPNASIFRIVPRVTPTNEYQSVLFTPDKFRALLIVLICMLGKLDIQTISIDWQNIVNPHSSTFCNKRIRGYIAAIKFHALEKKFIEIKNKKLAEIKKEIKINYKSLPGNTRDTRQDEIRKNQEKETIRMNNNKENLLKDYRKTIENDINILNELLPKYVVYTQMFGPGTPEFTKQTLNFVKSFTTRRSIKGVIDEIKLRMGKMETNETRFIRDIRQSALMLHMQFGFSFNEFLPLDLVGQIITQSMKDIDGPRVIQKLELTDATVKCILMNVMYPWINTQGLGITDISSSVQSLMKIHACLSLKGLMSRSEFDTSHQKWFAPTGKIDIQSSYGFLDIMDRSSPIDSNRTVMSMTDFTEFNFTIGPNTRSIIVCNPEKHIFKTKYTEPISIDGDKKDIIFNLYAIVMVEGTEVFLVVLDGLGSLEGIGRKYDKNGFVIDIHDIDALFAPKDSDDKKNKDPPKPVLCLYEIPIEIQDSRKGLYVIIESMISRIGTNDIEQQAMSNQYTENDLTLEFWGNPDVQLVKHVIEIKRNLNTLRELYEQKSGELEIIELQNKIKDSWDKNRIIDFKPYRSWFPVDEKSIPIVYNNDTYNSKIYEDAYKALVFKYNVPSREHIYDAMQNKQFPTYFTTNIAKYLDSLTTDVEYQIVPIYRLQDTLSLTFEQIGSIWLHDSNFFCDVKNSKPGMTNGDDYWRLDFRENQIYCLPRKNMHQKSDFILYKRIQRRGSDSESDLYQALLIDLEADSPDDDVPAKENIDRMDQIEQLLLISTDLYAIQPLEYINAAGETKKVKDINDINAYIPEHIKIGNDQEQLTLVKDSTRQHCFKKDPGDYCVSRTGLYSDGSTKMFLKFMVDRRETLNEIKVLKKLIEEKFDTDKYMPETKIIDNFLIRLPIKFSQQPIIYEVNHVVIMKAYENNKAIFRMDLDNQERLRKAITVVQDMYEIYMRMRDLGLYYCDITEGNTVWDEQGQRFMAIDFGGIPGLKKLVNIITYKSPTLYGPLYDDPVFKAIQSHWHDEHNDQFYTKYMDINMFYGLFILFVQFMTITEKRRAIPQWIPGEKNNETNMGILIKDVDKIYTYIRDLGLLFNDTDWIKFNNFYDKILPWGKEMSQVDKNSQKNAQWSIDYITNFEAQEFHDIFKNMNQIKMYFKAPPSTSYVPK